MADVVAAAATVLVVDQDERLRGLLGSLFERAGFAMRNATTSEAAIRAATKERPVAAVVEVELEEGNGYQLCRDLRDAYGDDFPIVLTSAQRVDPIDRVAGLLIGADDYIVKPVAPEEILARVRRLVQRSTNHRARTARSAAEFGLTPREHEVLRLLPKGGKQAAIARELFISPKTVATHIQHILTKLGAHSRAEAVAIGYRTALLEDIGEEDAAG